MVAAQTFPGFNQGVLRELPGRRLVSAKCHGLPQQAGGMGAIDFAVGLGISRLSPFQQTPSVGSFDFHESWIQVSHNSIRANPFEALHLFSRQL
jgi:hypothetical protein